MVLCRDKGKKKNKRTSYEKERAQNTGSDNQELQTVDVSSRHIKKNDVELTAVPGAAAVWIETDK